MSNKPKLKPVIYPRKDNFIRSVDVDGDRFIVEHASDVDPYLKAAHAQRKANFHDSKGFSKSGNFRKVASIPPIMVQKLMKEDPEIFNDPKRLLKKIKEWKEKGLDFTVVDKI